MKYIGVVGHTVPEDAEGYEQYEGKLIHWHIVGIWTDGSVTGGKLNAGLENNEAYHYDTAKPYKGRHQIDVLIDRQTFTIPHRSPNAARYFFPVLKDLTASQLEGTIIKGKNLHNYEYNGDFSGCLGWSKALIKVLAKNGYIAENALATIEKEVLNKVRGMKDYLGPMYTIPKDDGVFFFKRGATFNGEFTIDNL